MLTFPLPPKYTRLGFHYHPDTQHYRKSDLETWLPELNSQGASWLTLLAPLDRAIPEYFLSELIGEGIEPILHLPLSLDDSPPTKELSLLFSTYRRWGVDYMVLYNRPNTKGSWQTTAWAQIDLVERFLDRFIPAAQTALNCGLLPVFPPLEPGGDYWDTTFLRAALQALQRRGQVDLIHNLVLSAIAQAGDRPLNWGAGGPERWPGARPYYTPPGQQDQLGFRIFDWYLTISQAVIGRPVPIFLFEAGSYRSKTTSLEVSTQDEPPHTERNSAIIQALTQTGDRAIPALRSTDNDPGQIPDQVLACNFRLLSPGQNDLHLNQGRLKTNGQTLPMTGMQRQRPSGFPDDYEASGRITSPPSPSAPSAPDQKAQNPSRPIYHYLLLPTFEWGISDWYLDAIRPFVKKHHPTIGFSLEEAVQAARVTVVGSRHLIPETNLDKLRASGCVVERIGGDGTSIATILASR